jgi:hypothetical protein
MAEQEDGLLFSTSLQGSEEIPSAWRGFENLARNGLCVENILKEPCPFHFVSRRVNGIDTNILLEVLNNLF